MEIRTRHWNIAIFTAVLLHAATAFALLWTPPPPGAQLPGVGGIEVSLGPAGGAPGAEATEVPPMTETQAVEAVETKTPEPVEPVPVETPPVPVETAALPPEVAIEPVKPVETKPQELMPLPPKVVRPKVTPPPAPKPEPEKPVVQEPPRKATQAPSVAGTQGRAGTKTETEAGSGDNSQGGGAAGAAADYMSVLQAWLEKHKEYPRSARLNRIEGAVLLYFSIDREGRLLDFRIERSSGHRLLDTETLAMIERAKPLPPIPDDMRRDRLDVVVPVQFTLR